MTLLLTSAFDRAAEFIATSARPLERAQFEYHFGSGTVASVLKELGKFQNEDGGFGHGVEPDVRMPHSSPFVSSVAFQVIEELSVPSSHQMVRDGITSSVAFQVIEELSVPSSHQMVRDGITYFERTYDESIVGWDPTGPGVDEHAHAPWWNYTPVGVGLTALQRSNPGAEITGYLHLYNDSATDGFVQKVIKSALETFDELPDGMEVHSMLCFARLAEMAPAHVGERLLPGLHRGVHLVTGRSADDWKAYGVRPLSFAENPESLLARELGDAIQAQLDFEIDSQSEDGSWKPNWAWGQYEDDWALAKIEWSGYLTLRNLLALKAWGRI